MEGAQLIYLNRARQSLALAKSIDEVKDIRDKAEALRAYAKQAGMSLEMQNECAEIKLRAERRAGDMLAEMEKNPGGGLVQFHPETTLPPRLSELGISRIQSHRWQLERSVPEDVFEKFAAETKAKNEELTSMGLRRLAIRERYASSKPRPPLPEGVFNVIYADLPWQYSNILPEWGPAQMHYPTLDIEELCYYTDDTGTAIQEKFANNAVLFLWVTNPFLRDAFQVIDAWDFTYKTNMVWVKTGLKKPGSGFFIRGRHELLFICTKGSFVPDQVGKEPIGSVIEWEDTLMADVRQHSKKPDEVYGLIERIYTKPESNPDQLKYLELFARNKRQGWTSWGDELRISPEVSGGERALQPRGSD